MLNKILSVCLIIMFFVAPAIADRGGRGDGLPHGKWWNNTEVSSQLKLSDNEIKILNDTYTNHRRKIIKLRAVVEEEQFELNNLIDSKTINDEAILNQAKKLEKARSELSFEQFKFFLDVRKLLGFDRYQQLKSTFQRMHNKRRSSRFREKMGQMFHGKGAFNPSSMPYNHHTKRYGKNNYNDINALEHGNYSEPDEPSDTGNDDDVVEERL